MRRDDLKPCPFCGSLNVDHAAPASDGPPHPECLDCGASARDLRTWNRRAALEAEQPVAVDIPADLVERCSEIFGWNETGILTGDKLRGQARAIRGKFDSVFDAGEALRQAEEETKREAMRFIIALSTTRIADSAEAGGSATLSKGQADEV